MKRTKLMLGVAALSAALLGTGYAALTDVLTIDTTVKTANFDVDFDENNSTLKVGNIVANEANKNQIETQYEITEASAEVNEAEDNVTIKVGPLTPGVPVTYTTTMKNMSNIDAQLNSVRVSAEDATLNKHTQVKLVLTKETGEQRVITGNLDVLSKQASHKIQEVILQEMEAGNDTLGLKLTLELDDTELNDKMYEKEDTLQFSMNFDWAQKANK